LQIGEWVPLNVKSVSPQEVEEFGEQLSKAFNTVVFSQDRVRPFNPPSSVKNYACTLPAPLCQDQPKKAKRLWAAIERRETNQPGSSSSSTTTTSYTSIATTATCASLFIHRCATELSLSQPHRAGSETRRHRQRDDAEKLRWAAFCLYPPACS